QQLFELSPHALRRQVVERNPPAQIRRCGIESEFQPCGELNGTEDTQAVIAERRRIDHTQQTPPDVAAAVERVEVVAGQRIPGNRVDGEIPPARSLFNAHRRIAGHLEAAVAPPGFRLAAGQRDVDVARFEYL